MESRERPPYRAEEADDSAPLAEFERGLYGIGVSRATIEVDRLPASDMEALMRALHSRASPTELAAIAREAEGSPFFASQLARYLQAGGAGGVMRLEEVLGAHIALQAPAAQAVLEAVSLSVVPAPRSVVLEAARVTPGTADPIADLRHARLVRLLDGGANPHVAPYHDRIRESVTASLGDETRRAVHSALATAWQHQGDADPEVLLAHLLEAGQRDSAGPLALAAAEQAERGLAFDRAAERYAQALELLAPRGDERGAILTRLASALGAAGYGPNAADKYLEAAELADPEGRRELRWSAVEQLLFSQNEPRAAALVKEVMPELGIPLPGPRWRGARLAARVLKIAMLPPPGRVLPAGRRNARAMRQFDRCVAVASGLNFGLDAHLANYFHTECYRLGFESGDPGRIAYGLAAREGLRLYTLGESEDAVTRRLERAHALLVDCNERATRAQGHLGCASVWLLLGLWRKAAEDLEVAHGLFSGLPGAKGHQAQTARVYLSLAHWYLGNLSETRRRLSRDVEVAEARGNRHVRRSGRYRLGLVAVAAGNLDAAREHLRRSRDAIEPATPGYFDMMAPCLESLIDRYTGDAERALDRHEALDTGFRRSPVKRLGSGIVLPSFAATTLACAARGGAGATRLQRQALRLAGELRRMTSWRAVRIEAKAIEAAVAFQRGNRAQADALLTEAESGYQRYEMALYLAMTRRQRGLMLGGAEGAHLVAEADAALTARGVAEPERFTHAMLGGFATESVIDRPHADTRLPS